MSGGSKKKSGGKKGGTQKGGDNTNNSGSNGNDSGSNNQSSSSNPLIRPSTNRSINPRSILTGFYQKNGKRVQHTVQDGALQMPKDSWDVIATATTKLGQAAPPRKYALPGLDSVVRPCLDTKLESIVVTELVMEKVQIPQEQQPAVMPPVAAAGSGAAPPAFQPPVIKMIKTSRPAAKNRTIRRIPTKQAAAERIRGGGDEGQLPNQQTPLNPPPAAMPATASAVPSTTPQAVPGAAPAVQNTETSDVVMAVTEPAVPAAPPPQDAKSEPVPRDTTVAMDTTSTAAPVAVPKVTSTVGNANTTPVSNWPGDKIETNRGATPAIQPPATGDKIAANSALPTTLASVSNLPKAEPPATVSAGAQDAPISETPSSISPPTNTPAPVAVGLASNESGGKMETTPCSKNEESTQQQPAPSQTPTVATTAASTTASSSESTAKVAQGSVQIEVKGVTTNNATAVTTSISQIQSAPTVQAQAGPSVAAAKTTQADTKLVPSVASVAPIATAPSTVNPVAEISKESSAVKTESRAPTSAVSTAGSGAPQTASAVPVVASSAPSAIKAATAPPQGKEEEKKPAEKIPEAKALQSKPGPQWEQHKPGPNDETITPENHLPPKPEWYKKDGINELERTMLPEWFDESSSHRTPESYVKTREKIIEMSEALSNRNVTNAMIRRSILGDAGSLQRLRSFLVNWGIINRDGINDSAPTTASLRPDLKRSAAKFTDDMRDSLILAVTEQATKKRKLMASPSSPTPSLSLDWEEIASKVGYGVSAEHCRENFMTAPLKEEASTAMDVSDDAGTDGVSPESMGSNQSLIENLVASSSPVVVKKVFDAAMEATDFNSVETRAASLLGLHLTQAIETARGHEIDLALRLSKLLDTRMQKLENRMAMMDDVEGILEAEKVALEMERRDLYTARCRHWFGGV